jgi:hypothetical protein
MPEVRQKREVVVKTVENVRWNELLERETTPASQLNVEKSLVFNGSDVME